MAPPTSAKMAAVGRNLARAQAQASSGGKGGMPKDSAGGSKPYGGGTIRGTKGATSGKKWKGVT